MTLTEDIRNKALEIGFDRIGFTSMEPFEQLSAEFDDRPEMYNWVSENLLQLRDAVDLRKIMPSGKTVIVLLWDYYKNSFPPEFEGKIGKAYQVKPYSRGSKLVAMMKLFRMYLKDLGIDVVMRSGLPDRQAASRAGLGTFGRNNFLYASGIGSYVAIVTMIVDCELETENKEPTTSCPDSCRKCIQACPTGALYEPFRMNPLKCVAFHTYGTGNFPFVPEEITSETREKMGTWIYGCDICQDVCPLNKNKQKAELLPDNSLAALTSVFTLYNLLNMDQDFYLTKAQPFFYGYIWDKKFLQRNAAIALGNSGGKEAVPHLEKALRDPEDIVRAHAAWALGKIGDGNSRCLIEKLSKDEPSPRVFAEMRRALEKL